MTFPSFVLGVLISTLPGALFHLWRGGGPGKLLLYILLGWVGFWAGIILGSMAGLEFWNIGPLNVGMGLVGSLLFLGVGYWLSLIQAD
ncbi:MAG: hypothetical protein GYA48_04715 [Chloroflexi bacterium]|nr:hypothetical protein [Chloroflexota bacterium]